MCRFYQGFKVCAVFNCRKCLFGYRTRLLCCYVRGFSAGAVATEERRCGEVSSSVVRFVLGAILISLSQHNTVQCGHSSVLLSANIPRNKKLLNSCFPKTLEAICSSFRKEGRKFCPHPTLYIKFVIKVNVCCKTYHDGLLS
jgi:hypothetical protein